MLALTILNPKLNFSEAQTDKMMADGIKVVRSDGLMLDAYDLKRLQVSIPTDSNILRGVS